MKANQRMFNDYVQYINTILRIPKEPEFYAIDLFAGCGGLSLGFEAAGIKTVGYEIKDDCCKTYEHNLDTECHRIFITEDTQFPSVDIVIGGPPCQPFSRIGKRMGQGDDRNGFPSFIAAIRRIKPSIWICENVRGLPEQNKAYFEQIISEFKSLGYEVDYRVVSMVKHDVPQNRERLVMVGHHGGFQFPPEKNYKITAGEALGELALTLPSHPAFLTPSMDEYIAKYEKASKCRVPRDLHLDKPARTLTCRNLAGATSDMHRIRLEDGRRRRITVREAARLQGFPDWYEFCGTEEEQFYQIGNAVPPIFAYYLAQSVKDYIIKKKRNPNMRYENYNDMPSINYKKTFNQKSDETKKLILEALQILGCLGIPVDSLTERQKEKTAMALLAVGDVKRSSDWKNIKDSRKQYALTTREIIAFHNKYLEENISSGSYDDIRRQDLQQMLICDIVRQSSPDANTSDPTRGYQINPEYARVIKNYGQKDWFQQVNTFNKSHKTYEERLSTQRNIPKISVTMSDGQTFELRDGEHNAIQKAVVEEFLPRFGFGAQILYFGDSDNKYGLIFEEQRLKELGFGDFKQNKLPDIVAYSCSKGWVYLIEAYHTSNPINRIRKYALEQLAGAAAAKAVYVTAFENLASYKECTEELAWETEVWIATDPDHMIHRDGERFLGPYQAH